MGAGTLETQFTYCVQRRSYVPISRKEFHTVEIYIRDDTGNPVPFEFKKVMVTLHWNALYEDYYIKQGGEYLPAF